MQTRSSMIPRVVGILAVIFACIGVLFFLGVGAAIGDDLKQFESLGVPLGHAHLWNVMGIIAAVVIFVLHLTAGILGIIYSRKAPLFLNLYAIVALLVALGTIVSSLVVKNIYTEETLAAAAIISILAVPWPVVVLALINQKSARESCRGQAPKSQTPERQAVMY